MRSVGDKVPVDKVSDVTRVAHHVKGGYFYELFSDKIGVIEVQGSWFDIRAVRFFPEREWYLGVFDAGPNDTHFLIDEGPYEKLAAALVALKLRG